MEQNQQSLNHLTEEFNRLVGSMVQACQRTLDTIVGEVNVTTTSTIEDLSSLSTVTSTMTSSSHAHHNSQALTLASLQREVEQFYGRVREEVSRIEELESRCLNQEYAVYNPTGNTPVRADYRYPRSLAATSPHERILARFRAMRQNSNDDDCILVEGDNEPRSDSESSASEDSAVVFAAPSPPSNENHQPHIVKCTSETDIYLRRRQQEQGKENANRSFANFKKPSKLPAPTSHKKPLFERNTDN